MVSRGFFTRPTQDPRLATSRLNSFTSNLVRPHGYVPQGYPGGIASQSIFPTIRYRDANAAIEWLKGAFGFAENAVHRDDEGVVLHAQLELGGSMIMLGEYREGGFLGEEEIHPATSPVSIYVVLADVDAHHDRAVAAGAEIIRPPVDKDYGGRDYGVRDLEGNAWWFGTYDPYAPS